MIGVCGVTIKLQKRFPHHIRMECLIERRIKRQKILPFQIEQGERCNRSAFRRCFIHNVIIDIHAIMRDLANGGLRTQNPEGMKSVDLLAKNRLRIIKQLRQERDNLLPRQRACMQQLQDS